MISRLQNLLTFHYPKFSALQLRCATSDSPVQQKDDALYSIEGDEENLETLLEEKKAELERKRDKSRLAPAHRKMLFCKMPYEEPKNEFHETITYKRRMFGRYGHQSGIDPGTLWPTKTELENILEYEKVAHPFTVHELIEREVSKKKQEEALIQQRQEQIEKNMAKLEGWKKDVKNRAAKREAEFTAAKAKKEALVEEVRRHFGFKVDPRDERFKELLQQKEKENKKKMKEQKAKEKQERLLQRMMNPET